MIPKRLKLTNADPKQYTLAVKLCTEIESLLEEEKDAHLLIAEWNNKISTHFIYEADDFKYYYASISRDTFIRKALSPLAMFDDLLTYTESLAILDSIGTAEYPEHELDYYLEVLDANFPNGEVSDLLYWPNEWFVNGVDLHVELSNKQIVYCLSCYTNRWFKEQAKEVVLPPEVELALKNKVASSAPSAAE